MPSAFQILAASGAALIAGGINSVAGGGTMVSFPVLLALGVHPLLANATNTVGIGPGALGSLWGFRAELRKLPRSSAWLLVPGLLGSAVGAVLLRHTSAKAFERIVPGLVLFATAMFIVAPEIRRRLKQRRPSATASGGAGAGVFAALFLISIYGGYFGAGMGILLLSALSISGMTDMLEMTALTSLLSLATNAVAGVIFAVSGLVHWPYAGTMAIGAVLGGWGAAGIARKVGGVWIRRLVVTIGLGLGATMLYRVL